MENIGNINLTNPIEKIGYKELLELPIVYKEAEGRNFRKLVITKNGGKNTFYRDVKYDKTNKTFYTNLNRAAKVEKLNLDYTQNIEPEKTKALRAFVKKYYNNVPEEEILNIEAHLDLYLFEYLIK